MAGELSHLKIDLFFNPKQYVYPKPGGSGDFPLAERNRAIHGNNIIQQLNTIRDQFEIEKELPDNIVSDDALYVEFYSELDFTLDFERFDPTGNKPKYQLLNVKKEIVTQNNEEKERYKVVVMMREGGISLFLKKAGEYLIKNTKDSEGNDTGLPAHRKLFNNIELIKLASLKSFWSDEPEISFPEENEDVWWEAWFRRTDEDNEIKIQQVINNLTVTGAQIGQQTLNFPEHIVKLIKGTAKQLSSSLILLDNLAELRKPQQLNDFITGSRVSIQDKQLWVEDLKSRTDIELDDNSCVVCLLDSGVNNKHPLLSNVIPDSKLYTYKDAWGKEDTWDEGGHGTGMAGLAMYGDLTEALATTGSIKILHGLESFKIVHPNDPHEPEMYGVVTEYACSTPVIDFPNNPRVYCLAITDKNLAFKGRPSTWSAAIDKIAYGRLLETPQLFVVSGGNVNYLLPQLNSASFPSHNETESVHDPSQSYNALTVGTYTRMDRIDQAIWPGIVPLAPNGSMSPSNSTSLLWDNHWPIKPDIVMEGGNLAVQGTALLDNVHTLKPLSLDKDFANYLLYPFGDTSGAAALASKLAAELKSSYPHFWPETIRALIVHSAEWTPVMLNGINFRTATVEQKRSLLRTFGYGVPIKEKAFYSAKNSLTLIAENIIQPYRLKASSVKTNEYHLYDIPWPTDILQNLLTEKDIKLKITLSYFIDPNPGNKRYANNYSYHSHSLDFKMIRPAEDIKDFKRRVSGDEENKDIAYNGQEEPWALKEAMRNKGSIKKDFIISSGADLATRNTIAIYPKGGWYSSRKKLGMVETKVRYSLIVSIETEETEVDIYNPVLQLIENTVPSI